MKTKVTTLTLVLGVGLVVVPVFLAQFTLAAESGAAAAAAGTPGVLPRPDFQRIVAVISFALIQTALLVLLFGNLVKRRRAERSLRESEERLSLATAAADVGVWMWDVACDPVWATANWRRMFGFPPDATLTFETVIQRIHPNDRAVVIRTMKQALEGRGHYVSEYRIVRADGIRWIATHGRLDSATGTKRRRMLGASVDITERKRAEQAAHELSGRLISAQEEERARLAKELHDGLSQNLALLAVELELLGQRPPRALDEVSERMQEFSTRTKELSSEVHRLSHGLHPAKLEQLGLAAAIGGFCRELEAGGLISVKFSFYGVPRTLPKDLALCLYRVTQEALQNVVKHSGARNATVELRKEANELQLRIADDGKGFDATAEPTDGLGLVSMRSRVRFVGGNISWDSTPGQGTRVNVRAPVTARMIERNGMTARRARRGSSVPRLCARPTGCFPSNAAAVIHRLS